LTSGARPLSAAGVAAARAQRCARRGDADPANGGSTDEVDEDDEDDVDDEDDTDADDDDGDEDDPGEELGACCPDIPASHFLATQASASWCARVSKCSLPDDPG
jgi:hypothetical protein